MASTYLSRTASSAGNRRTWTWSSWVKRSDIITRQEIFSQYANLNVNEWFELAFNTDNTIFASRYSENVFSTNQVFRDTSAWYHIVLAVDTTQATASDRVKFYINGVQVTSFSSITYPTQNDDTGMNMASLIHIGNLALNNNFKFDGSMSHVHLIDGTAYDASAFGETDATTGIWKPKTAPSVTYGTNGFFLKFENSGAFGTDSSGNGNNFTVNGTMTQTVDTPSNVFATLNALANNGSGTLAYGNTEISASGTVNFVGTTGTLGFNKGKYYWEMKVFRPSGTLYVFPGVTCTPNLNFVSVDRNEIASYRTETQGHTYQFASNGAEYYYNDTTLSYPHSSFSNGDIVSIAMDADNNKLYLGINGTWQNSDDPTSGATGTGAVSTISPDATVGSYTGSGYWIPCINVYYESTTKSAHNFGNGYFGTTAVASAQNPDDGIGIFEYEVPADYKALCTKSINAQEYS